MQRAQGTQVIMGNRHLLEKHPNMYQHKVAILAEENCERFPLLAITNLDHVKTLHLAKGEVVGFARPESSEVTYIATTNELNIEEAIDVNAKKLDSTTKMEFCKVKQYKSRKL